MSDNVLGTLLYALIRGLFFSFPVTPVFCYLRKVFYVPFAQKNMLEKAIADGHVVKAKLADSSAMMGGKEYAVMNGEWRCIYQYQYDGKTYKYRGISRGWPAEEITLYFQTKPNRACTYHELGYRESNWIKFYWWMLIVCTLGSCAWELYQYGI